MAIFGKTRRGQFYPKRGLEMEVIISKEILPFRGSGVTVLPGEGPCPVGGCKVRGVHIHAATDESPELEDTLMHEKVHVVQLQDPETARRQIQSTRGIEPGTYEYFTRYRFNPTEQEAEVFGEELARERRRLLKRADA